MPKKLLTHNSFPMGLLVAALLADPFGRHLHSPKAACCCAASLFVFSGPCEQVRGPVKTKKAASGEAAFGEWVEDGTRTHDSWNHNPVL